MFPGHPVCYGCFGGWRQFISLFYPSVVSSVSKMQRFYRSLIFHFKHMCLVLQNDFSFINTRELLITLFLSLFWPEISFVLWHTVCFQCNAKPTRLPWCWCRWCKVMQNLQEGYCSHRQLYRMQSSPSEVSVNGEVEQDKIYWLWNSNWKSLYLCIYYKYSCNVGFGVREVAMIRSAVILYFF